MSFFVISPVSATSHTKVRKGVVEKSVKKISKNVGAKLIIHDDAYAAKFVDQSPEGRIIIAPGKAKTVIFRFKNVGTALWKSKGSRFVSAYTIEPRNRNSIFFGKEWISANQTISFVQKKIAPRETGELAVVFHAPAKEGDYAESFSLASEGHSWIKGGVFSVDIHVGTDLSPKEPQKQSPVFVPYEAHTFIQTLRGATAVGGQTFDIVVGFQNVGTSTWPRYEIHVPDELKVASAVSSSASFADDSWQSRQVVLSTTTAVAPEGIVRTAFRFRAPSRRGTYTAVFRLAVDGFDLSDSSIFIPVTVTADAPDFYQEPWSTNSTDSSSNISFGAGQRTVSFRFPEEPRIRVGLWKPDSPVQFSSVEDAYDVYTGITRVGTIPQRIPAILSYDSGVYSLAFSGMVMKSTAYIRLSPVGNPHSVFVLPNLERRIRWKGQNNFNTYRGALEYRMSNDEKHLYVINDLLLEDYIAGIGETSNVSNIEYIKALLTAARTYAYYIQRSTDKHEKGNFDVAANTGDQLYLGYVSEELMPRVVEAARETRGDMITYNKNIVITPYYGNSDGRTRAWTEVWGGSAKPWLVSVPTTYDRRDHRHMHGHGVGMSARDASIRADEEGMNFVDLLKYYYTGIEVERMYQ